MLVAAEDKYQKKDLRKLVNGSWKINTANATARQNIVAAQYQKDLAAVQKLMKTVERLSKQTFNTKQNGPCSKANAEKLRSLWKSSKGKYC